MPRRAWCGPSPLYRSMPHPPRLGAAVRQHDTLELAALCSIGRAVGHHRAEPAAQDHNAGQHPSREGDGQCAVGRLSSCNGQWVPLPLPPMRPCRRCHGRLRQCVRPEARERIQHVQAHCAVDGLQPLQGLRLTPTAFETHKNGAPPRIRAQPLQPQLHVVRRIVGLETDEPFGGLRLGVVCA
jgi:hypothetical protein